MLLAWQHADTRFVHQPKRWCIYRKQGGGSGRVAKVISTGQKTPFKLGTDTLLKFIDDSKKRGQLDVTLSRTDKWIKHCALAGYWKNVIWVKHRVHKWQIFTSKNTKGGLCNTQSRLGKVSNLRSQAIPRSQGRKFRSAKRHSRSA